MELYATSIGFLFIMVDMVCSDTLQLAHVLYRHGARSPTRFFPTNPNQIDAWPDGTGRLTQKGMVMEYTLGKVLNEKYVVSKFLNASYLHKEVYIRSSSFDRCLQSAESQLAGLYPPSGKQAWNKDIAWQPIPVQTVPGNEDSILRPADTDCPRIGEIMQEMLASDEVKKKTAENQELLDYMTKNSGENISLTSMWDVTDDILCEKAEGLKSAEWVDQRFPEILNLSNWAFNYLYQGSDELGRLLGGSLLGVINKNMAALRDGETKKLHKVNIFSGHDTSILAFTTALNIRFPIPSFSACVFTELYKDSNGSYYVTINYRNGFNEEANSTQMQLPGCQYKCPLDDFLSITSSRVPVNRKKECRVKPDFFTKKRLKVIAAILLALTIFLFLLFIWMVLRYKCRKRMILDKYQTVNKTKIINDDEESDENATLVI